MAHYDVAVGVLQPVARARIVGLHKPGLLSIYMCSVLHVLVGVWSGSGESQLAIMSALGIWREKLAAEVCAL